METRMDVTDVISTQESVGRKAVKVLYPLFMGQFFGLVLTAATFIIVTRLLGPADYGIYVFAFGFSTLVNGVAAFGVGAYFNSELAGLAYRKDGSSMLHVVNSGYIIAGAVGIALSLLGIALSAGIAGFFPKVGITPLTLMLTSAQIFFYMISMVAVNGLVGLSRSGLAAITNIVVDIIQLALSIALTVMYGVNGAVAAMLIGYAVGAVFGTALLARALARYIKPRVILPAMEHLRKTFSFVWPIAANNFLNTGMANFSILFLGLFVFAAAIGNYGAANRGLTLVAMLYGTFGQGMLNTFTTARSMKKAGEVNKTYNDIMRFSLIFMLPVVVFVGVMATPSLYLLISSNYASAPLYLMLMCIGTTIGLFGSNISNLLISSSHTKSVLFINMVSAAVQFVLILALVPGMYAAGASDIYMVGTAIITIYFVGNAVELFMFVREAGRKLGLRIDARSNIMLYAVNALLGISLVAWLAVSSSLLQGVGMHDIAYVAELAGAVAICVVAYPALLVALRAVSGNDMKDLREATAKLGVISAVMGLFLDYSGYLHRKLASA
jgi:O-antigen/teichoic acid export membrane protein